MLTIVALGFAAAVALAYRFYAAWVARQIGVDDRRETPAVRWRDGVDYVPTRPFYLFAQHFSAIAAAGPIAGPIIACQRFGWAPCLAWIALGVVLIGAVHDMSSLFASVRHGARSVAEIAREELGRGAGLAMLAFIWIALVYVIVAFTEITARSFVVGPDELGQGSFDFHAGGAVAASSTMYLGLAILLGLVQRFLRPPLWLATVVFVPATFALAWLGTHCSATFALSKSTWALVILAYCAVASGLPVWALLQPRGYLGGFVLYAALFLGLVGVLFGGYSIAQPAFKTWNAGGPDGSLFPFLFVTIACGACSGFHGLVCSGTTSKQLERESHVRPIGYAAMLAEGLVALIALVTVMIVAQSDLAGLAPGTIYGNGIGRFLTLILGEDQLEFAVTFGAMAFSTFVFDTLDVTTRLGRYIAQELLGLRRAAGAVVGTVATLALPAALLFFGEEGMYARFWVLFGASNQLLAALTLLLVSVWLSRSGRSTGFTLWPMLFVLAMTLWALVKLVIENARASTGLDVALANAGAALAFVGLAVYIVLRGLVVSRRRTPPPVPQAPEPPAPRPQAP